MKVVILAGGLGTRLSELTKTIPKPMVKINGKPMLVRIMEHYSKFGFNFSDFPQSEKYYAEAISIPIYPDLSHESQELVYKLIKSQVENS